MAHVTESDRERLREMIEKVWVRSCLNQGWDELLDLCADEVVYMPQDSPSLQGRAALKAFFSAFPTIVGMTQRLEAVSGDTEVAVIRGSFAGTIEAEGQRLSGEGKFLGTATKRTGEWQFTASCFNWDAPLTADG